jgi:hypothetical protein
VGLGDGISGGARGGEKFNAEIGREELISTREMERPRDGEMERMGAV